MELIEIINLRKIVCGCVYESSVNIIYSYFLASKELRTLDNANWNVNETRRETKNDYPINSRNATNHTFSTTRENLPSNIIYSASTNNISLRH